jgi:hypothetical protein
VKPLAQITVQIGAGRRHHFADAKAAFQFVGLFCGPFTFAVNAADYALDILSPPANVHSLRQRQTGRR